MSYIPNVIVITQKASLSRVLGMKKVRDIVKYAEHGDGEKELLMVNAPAVISD